MFHGLDTPYHYQPPNNAYQHAPETQGQGQPQDVVKRTIYVASIDSSMTREQLHQLFSSCGVITNIRLCGDAHHNTRFAFIEFATIQSAEMALKLNQLNIGNSALRVAMAKAPINKASPRTPNSGYGAIGQSTHSTVNANLPFHALPPEKQDAVSRTVYIGSVDVKIAGSKLVEFFVQCCGPVVKSRLAGDSYHDTRFAFIEFASIQGAQKALQLTGSYIGNFPIKVSMAKAPILNDSAVVHYHPPQADQPQQQQQQLSPAQQHDLYPSMEANRSDFDPTRYSATFLNETRDLIRIAQETREGDIESQQSLWRTLGRPFQTQQQSIFFPSGLRVF